MKDINKQLLKRKSNTLSLEWLLTKGLIKECDK